MHQNYAKTIPTPSHADMISGPNRALISGCFYRIYLRLMAWGSSWPNQTQIETNTHDVEVACVLLKVCLCEHGSGVK